MFVSGSFFKGLYLLHLQYFSFKNDIISPLVPVSTPDTPPPVDDQGQPLLAGHEEQSQEEKFL